MPPNDGLILYTLDGAIVPVRAIPYVTGRAITPRAIASAIADDRQDPDGRQFETDLHAGYVDAEGNLNPTACADLVQYAQHVSQLFEGEASLVDQVAAMPAGVYLPCVEVQSLVDETNSICGGPGGDGLLPAKLLRNPMVSLAVRALVLQGFEAFAKGRRRTPTRAPRVRRRGPSIGEEQDCSDVQAIALRLRATRRMSTSAMLREEELARYVRGWPENKLRAWISIVDSRLPSQKPGRRWPNASKR